MIEPIRGLEGTPRQSNSHCLHLCWLIGALVLSLSATPVFSHKLNVFAAAEGARISGSAYFAGGGKASGATILITDADGGVLAELEPAADGRFSYQASAPVEHHIIAETGDGHRAEWRIAASELTGGFPGLSAESHNPTVASQSDIQTESAAEPATETAAQVAAMAEFEAALARQIRPLREELLATRDALRLQDVLGGLGYIAGLTGLALWWRTRRSRV